MRTARLLGLVEAGTLDAVLTTSVEWMVPTPVGQVGLEVQVLTAPDARSTQDLVATWNARLSRAVEEVLAKGVANVRTMARALLERLGQAALEEAKVDEGSVAQLLEWPAALVLRPAGQDELQVRVRATLTMAAELEEDEDAAP